MGGGNSGQKHLLPSACSAPLHPAESTTPPVCLRKVNMASPFHPTPHDNCLSPFLNNFLQSKQITRWAWKGVCEHVQKLPYQDSAAQKLVPCAPEVLWIRIQINCHGSEEKVAPVILCKFNTLDSSLVRPCGTSSNL
jgi:hypothetical protein